MESNLFLQNLQEVLQKNYPPKTNLATEVAKILCMEKASAYRRLRGQVPFSFSEIAILAGTSGISLDELILECPPEEKVFTLAFLNHLYPSEEDYRKMEK